MTCYRGYEHAMMWYRGQEHIMTAIELQAYNNMLQRSTLQLSLVSHIRKMVNCLILLNCLDLKIKTTKLVFLNTSLIPSIKTNLSMSYKIRQKSKNKR